MKDYKQKANEKTTENAHFCLFTKVILIITVLLNIVFLVIGIHHALYFFYEGINLSWNSKSEFLYDLLTILLPIISSIIIAVEIASKKYNRFVICITFVLQLLNPNFWFLLTIFISY